MSRLPTIWKATRIYRAIGEGPRLVKTPKKRCATILFPTATFRFPATLSKRRRIASCSSRMKEQAMTWEELEGN
jgi:hypothetical protein